MPRYTANEMTDIHLAYGEARKDARVARLLYAAQFPGRHCPTSRTIEDIDRRLREIASFRGRVDRRGRPRTVRTPEFEEQVLYMVGENPGRSTRSIARALGVSHRQVWETLHEQLHVVVVVGRWTRQGRKGLRKAGLKKALRPPQDLLQGTVATKAVRKSALGLSRRVSFLKSRAVEYLAAEVPYFLLRAPADVGPIKRGEDIVAAASWGVIAPC